MAPVVRFAPVGSGHDLTLLTAAERSRHDRLRLPADRAAYAAAHLLVRDCVAAFVGTTRAEVVIAQRCEGCGATEHGAPYVEGLVGQVHVSLSHARGWVAAVAAAAPCGIDVEAVRHVPDRALTEEERAWAGDDPVLRSRLWARKEALAKAGLVGLRGFWRSDARDADPRLREWQADGAVGAWIVAD